MSGRWDPERFMREREQREFAGRARDRGFDDPLDHHHHLHQHLDHHLDDFEDDFRRPAHDHDQFEFEGRFDRRSGESRAQIVAERSAGPSRRGRLEEEERVKVYYDEPRRARDPVFFDDDRDSLEIAARSALVPTRSANPRARRQSIHVEREYVAPPPQRALALPSRPKYVRRQSSLDTFDRRPMPVPLPRRQSPPPVRRYERVERERVRMPEPDYFIEEPSRDYRELERSHREYRFKATEVDEPEPLTRPGKTRMPRRLVEKSAIDVLGYPFEEELDHIVILRALAKDQIDEIVNVSKEIRSSRTTYVREDTKLLEAPPPQAHVETIERRSEIVIPPPPPAPVEIVRQVIREEVAQPTTVLKVPAATVTEKTVTEQVHHHHHKESRSERRKSRSSRRSKSKKRESSSSSSSDDGGSRHKHVVEEREESNHISGPLTMFARKEREERVIKSEIKALQQEEKALKLERQRDVELARAELIRKGADVDLRSDQRLDLGGIKVERNKKEPESRLLKALLVTLT